MSRRFREGFTLLPAAACYAASCNGELPARTACSRDLGWLMAAELRAVGDGFQFCPRIGSGLRGQRVIGDRAFASVRRQVAQIAAAWMFGAREAGMISVGKHFPGHGAVTADSHLASPIDERDLNR